MITRGREHASGPQQREKLWVHTIVLIVIRGRSEVTLGQFNGAHGALQGCR